MKDYLVFAMSLLIFVVVFFLLWKRRKNKNADVNYDTWSDVEYYDTNDPL